MAKRPTILRQDDDSEKLEVDSALAQCQDKGTDETAENLFKSHQVRGTRMQGNKHIGDYI